MRKKTLSIIAAMCAMVIFGFEAQAQEAMTRMKKDYPVAMQEYGNKMSELKTDYIIVIDVSATMNQYKDVVVPALTRFFDSIGDGNYVRVVTFGTQSKEELTRLELSKQTRPQIVNTLNYAYDVVTKDNGMKWYTDFALMGNKVVDLIQNDQDSDIHFVVLFTDLKDDWKKGKHHRPQEEWNKLAQRFKELEVPVNTLSTYFPHEQKDEPQILESIELISKAFPNFDYSSDINEVLGGKLEGSKYVIYTDKLKQLIVNDVNNVGKKELFTSIIAKDKSLMLEYDFDKDEVKAPRYIRGIVVDTCVLEENSPQIIEIDFDSHKEIAKRGCGRSIGKVVFEKGKIFVKDQTADYKMDYHFIYQINKDEKANSFTKDMEALGLLDKLPQKATVHSEGALVFVWPFWLIVLLCLMIVLFLFLLFKNTIIPGRIKNKKLLCKESLNDNCYTQNVNGKRTLMVGKADACTTSDWIIPDSDFIVRVQYRNGGPLNWIIKRKIMLHLEDETSEMRHEIKDKSYKVTSANILKGKVEVQSKGVRYEFNILDNYNTDNK